MLKSLFFSRTAYTLLKFRDIMWSMVQHSLETQGFVEHKNDLNLRQILEYKDKLFKTVSETLYMSSESIEKSTEKTSLA